MALLTPNNSESFAFNMVALFVIVEQIIFRLKCKKKEKSYVA